MAANRPPPDALLEKYRAKRSADRTPEPFGAGPGAGGPLRFCVQKHAARRLHWDFRLEWAGVLKSWAVPRGPSYDPKDKRMAVHVEDHPIDYAEFEGVIPDDNYGAGPVILWDRGTWEPLEDPDEGLEKGKLLFRLHGYKLRGEWTLVRTKGSARGAPSERRASASKDWLLIKHVDEWASASRIPGDESILSGLTLEELKEGPKRAAELLAEAKRLGALERPLRAGDVDLMLAQTQEPPFRQSGWLYELKYDGFRLLAGREGDRASLVYRRGSEVTHVYPDLAGAVAALPLDGVVLDGEVCVLDEQSHPSFQRLQKRALITRTADIARAALELPATYFAFDLLAAGGLDLRPLPLVQRKALLQRIIPRTGPLRYSDHVAERGADFFEAVKGMDLEGIVAKKADSPYKGGRSAAWVKVHVGRRGDFVVVGYSLPKGNRVGIGALHIAAWLHGTLTYIGRAGTGATDKQLEDWRTRLDVSRIDAPACVGPLPTGKGHVWSKPEYVVEVRFRECTEEGVLRHPVLLGERHDKTVEECLHPGEIERPEAAAPPPPAQEELRQVPYSNLEKVFWPEEGYTKGDLIEYYRQVAPWLLLYLRDRPVVLTRYPDGIHGKSFFQKDAPGFAPGWVRTVRMWSEDTQRDIDYFVCDSAESLLYLVNLGTIPLHVWSSRASRLQQPDWCILDLDPKTAPFADVVALALAIKELCDELGLPCFPKTSGSTGLHVLIPLDGKCTYEHSKTLAELLARIIAAEHPDKASVARQPSARGGKVYIDYLQNGHGKLLVSPLCVRPLPGAPVSAPLLWEEVGPDLRLSDHTIRTMPARLAGMGDPLIGVLSATSDLGAALQRLAARVKPGSLGA